MAIQRENTNLILDFQAPNRAVVAHAKQNDKLSRILTCQLVDGEIPWTPPSNIMAAIRFKKADGFGGFYDVDEANNPAIVFTGSTVRLTLAEQVLTCPGPVFMELNVYTSASEKLTTFSWILDVEKSVLSDAEFQSTSYYNILTQQIADILGRVQSIAGLEAAATGVPWGSGTKVVVTGGTGAADPYHLEFQIEEGKSPSASVTQSGKDVKIAIEDVDGETEVNFKEPTARVETVGDEIRITMIDADGTTTAEVLKGSVRLAQFDINMATGNLEMDSPTDYDELTFSINNNGYLEVSTL